MKKIIALLLVLFVGEFFVRHVGTVHLNTFLFLILLAFIFIFWRLVFSIVCLIVKFIVGLFFFNIFK